MNVLDRILEEKRIEVGERSRAKPLSELRARVREVPPPRGFAKALLPESTGDGVFRIIAEVKKASPSKGVIREDFDPVAIARAYERCGAAAISVLTDEKFFQGRLEHLEAVRREVAVPLLLKDFIIDPYQVWEARAVGADAILLILAALPGDSLLAHLSRAARDLGMDVLWEVHDEDELRRLVPFGPRLVGINNRNLRTFEVSLATTRKLMPHVPDGAIAVSESGFFRREELELMRGWGVGAFLIGESLLRAADPGAALEELLRPAGGGRA